jgi:Spy/CpxP family protein refolding chaperone
MKAILASLLFLAAVSASTAAPLATAHTATKSVFSTKAHGHHHHGKKHHHHKKHG